MVDDRPGWTDSIVRELREPFDAHWQKSFEKTWKDRTGSKKSRAIPYAPHEAYRERLDQAVGPENWQTDVEIVTGGKRTVMLIRLTIFGVTKCQIGVSQKDEDDDSWGGPEKSAFANGFKRACEEFGVGADDPHLHRPAGARPSSGRSSEVTNDRRPGGGPSRESGPSGGGRDRVPDSFPKIGGKLFTELTIDELRHGVEEARASWVRARCREEIEHREAMGRRR